MEAAETSRRSLGELFVERGLISEDDLERALAEQVATKQRLADILVRRGLVTGRDITMALMEQLGSPAPTPAPESQTAELLALPTPPAEQAPDPLPAAEPELAVVSVPEPDVLSVPEPSSEPSISAPALVAKAASRRRAAEAELSAAREAHAQILRGLEQVRAELEARDLSTDGLTRELDQTHALLRRHEDELANEVERWEAAGRDAEDCDAELAEAQSDLEETQHALSEASVSAAAWAARASDLDAGVQALAGRVESAAYALETLAATLFTPDGDELSRSVVPTSPRIHLAQSAALYFLPKAEGYDLVEREGELPAVGDTLEFGGQPYVVTKIGRSPLPFDRRSCVFLTAV